MKQMQKVLYKYKTFDTYTLDALISDKIYLSDPNNFNDPLDCKPHVVNDGLNISELSYVLKKMLFRSSYSQNIHTYLPLLKQYGSFDNFYRMIDSITKSDTDEFICAVESFYSDDTVEYELILINSIQEQLTNQRIGVLSLASQYNCPLMWSHYGDQHNGVCIGYKIPGDADEFFSRMRVLKVDYDKPRQINVSLIKAACDGDSDAEFEIDNIIYSRKADKWAYEEEYRMISKVGLHPSPFILSDITFGLRCNPSVMYSVMVALSRRQSSLSDTKDAVKFYKMVQSKGSFVLNREPITFDDLWALPKDHQFIKNMALER
ncbi:DUF2971 domain-containing protein [Citrobacter portucalensis]|uniref:DUF2971 domain-containing protein n=1 Tax=Citrobacter portucalensis TaxID=1639133 RepID=UPI00137433DD|nr:DUF2971 domain-containing protein [Citrobacter portucalensis]MCR3701895.1 DUF2971 domain-containing protein [Citrobacter portucalensis]MDS0978185.1 DUF2971 domain-containing protein [Citrobacter portucalensis]BBV17371.1 hypothetical protein IOMTU157_2627 [Citrobacter portucalensis]